MTNQESELFEFNFLPTSNQENDDYMIEFISIQNSNSLIGRLLLLLKKLGFQTVEILDVWMNDEFWITAKSSNGMVTISKDIYDLVFILGENNIVDLQRIVSEMNNSPYFQQTQPSSN